MMKRSLLAIGSMVLALTICMSAGDKKPQKSVQVKPDQTVDLESPTLVTARQKCENWGVAAGLQAMLQQQGVKLDQSYWILRLYRGELCIDTLPSMEALTELVNREVVL